MVFACCLVDQGFVLQHFKHLLDCVGAVDDVGVAVGNGRSRVGQTGAVKDERGQFAGRQFRVARDDHVAPVPEDSHDADVGEELAEGVVGASQVYLFATDAILLEDDITIFVYFIFFSAVGLDKLNAREAFCDCGCYFCLDVLPLPHKHFLAFAVLVGDDGVDRHQTHDERGQLPTDSRQDYQVRKDYDCVPYQERQVVAHCRLSLLHVRA